MQIMRYIVGFRYLFKKALLEDDLAREEALERRKLKEKEVDEGNVKWDQGNDLFY